MRHNKHATDRKSPVLAFSASQTLMGKTVHVTEGNEAWEVLRLSYLVKAVVKEQI